MCSRSSDLSSLDFPSKAGVNYKVRSPKPTSPKHIRGKNIRRMPSHSLNYRLNAHQATVISYCNHTSKELTDKDVLQDGLFKRCILTHPIKHLNYEHRHSLTEELTTCDSISLSNTDIRLSDFTDVHINAKLIHTP